MYEPDGIERDEVDTSANCETKEQATAQTVECSAPIDEEPSESPADAPNDTPQDYEFDEEEMPEKGDMLEETTASKSETTTATTAPNLPDFEKLADLCDKDTYPTYAFGNVFKVLLDIHEKLKTIEAETVECDDPTDLNNPKQLYKSLILIANKLLTCITKYRVISVCNELSYWKKNAQVLVGGKLYKEYRELYNAFENVLKSVGGFNKLPLFNLLHARMMNIVTADVETEPTFESYTDGTMDYTGIETAIDGQYGNTARGTFDGSGTFVPEESGGTVLLSDACIEAQKKQQQTPTKPVIHQLRKDLNLRDIPRFVLDFCKNNRQTESHFNAGRYFEFVHSNTNYTETCRLTFFVDKSASAAFKLRYCKNPPSGDAMQTTVDAEYTLDDFQNCRNALILYNALVDEINKCGK